MRRLAWMAVGSSCGCVLVALLGSPAACSFHNDDAKPDTNPVIIEDTAKVDSTPTQPPLTVFVDSTGAPCLLGDDSSKCSNQPADFSCIGKPRDAGPINDADFDATDDANAPSGQLIDVTLDLVAFGGTGKADVIGGGEYDVFYSNSFKNDTAVPDLHVITDDKGMATFKLPAGERVAYRVKMVDDPDPKKTIRRFYTTDLLAPTKVGAPPIVINALRQSEYGTLALAVTGKADYIMPAGTGIFASRIVDCQNRYVGNASVEVVDVEASSNLKFGKCDGSAICRLFLSDLELPAPSATWTSRAGLVVIVNVPITGPSKHLQAVTRGVLTAGSEPVEIGRRDLEVFENAINVAFVNP